MRPRGWRVWVLGAVAAVLALVAAAAFVWREDIRRTALDPKQPYQTYRPPPAPDYARRSAWALLPADPAHGAAAEPAADVFFVHPTTFDGGEHWNAPIGARAADRVLFRTMIPNHAGPYRRVGRLFAPRYRQASLYTQLTLRDDAREARRFAYADVRAAFRLYRDRYGQGRPFLVVGVEQGGLLASRLVAEEIAPDPALRARFVGAHLIETVVAAPGPPGAPACAARAQSGCLVAWASVPADDGAAARRLLDRALVWDGDRLGGLEGRPALCVNPLIGAASEQPAPASANLGAADATRLEWGARPAFLRRQVGARCRAGVLDVTLPESASLRRRGSWAERRRAPAFNLFYADLEADAEARLRTWLARDPPAPPITTSIAVRPSPIHRIDER